MSLQSFLNTNSLLESQIMKLLKELQIIFNQKWILLNTEGFNYINSLFEIFQNYSDLFEKTENNSKTNIEFNFLNKCNDINEKLCEIVNNYQLLIKRINEIKKILSDLNQNNSIEIINILKDNLDSLSSDFNKDFQLKQALVKSLIFKSRLNRTDQVALISCWIHEPNIEFTNVLKFNHLINNFNKI